MLIVWIKFGRIFQKITVTQKFQHKIYDVSPLSMRSILCKKEPAARFFGGTQLLAVCQCCLLRVFLLRSLLSSAISLLGENAIFAIFLDNCSS
jgi:hypothetical protein